jgi:hypothetical protein
VVVNPSRLSFRFARDLLHFPALRVSREIRIQDWLFSHHRRHRRLEVTDYFWRYHFRTLRDAQQLSFTLSAEQQAQSAYFGRAPEIAEFELARLLDSPLLLTDRREQAFRRFVAHARLAKVQHAQGKQAEAQKNLQAALTLMHTAFPASNASSADDVLKALTTIDNATAPR